MSDKANRADAGELIDGRCSDVGNDLDLCAVGEVSQCHAEVPLAGWPAGSMRPCRRLVERPPAVLQGPTRVGGLVSLGAARTR